MYKKLIVKLPCKILMENIFTGEKESKEFIVNEEIEGRVDTIGSKLMLTLSDGFGGIINPDLFQEKK